MVSACERLRVRVLELLGKKGWWVVAGMILGWRNESFDTESIGTKVGGSER
jgi:hypothetical protein